MPIKFIEKLKIKSHKKSGDRDRMPKPQRHGKKNKKDRKSKVKKKEKKSSKLFKKSKRDKKTQPDLSNAKQTVASLNAGNNNLFIVEDRQNENEYCNPDPESLNIKISPAVGINPNLNLEYLNPDPKFDTLDEDIEIKKTVSDNELSAIIEDKVDADEMKLSKIRNTSPVANNVLQTLPSTSLKTRQEEPAALPTNSDTPKAESKRTDRIQIVSSNSLSKATRNPAPYTNELLTENERSSGEVDAEPSVENSLLSKTPKEPSVLASVPTISSPLDDLNSLENNEIIKVSNPLASTNTDSTTQNKLTPQIKASNQNQKTEPKPIVEILKKNISPTHISLSAQRIEDSSENTRSSIAKKLDRTFPESGVSTTEPKLDAVDDNPIYFRNVKEQWERISSSKSHLKGSKITQGSSTSIAASDSRSSKNKVAAASLVASSSAKVQPVSKQPNNGKERVKPDSLSTTLYSAEDSDMSSYSSSTSSSSSESSDSSSWSTSTSSNSNSDSSSSFSSSSLDLDSDSDSEVTTSSSSNSTSSTSTSVIRVKSANAQKNSHSKPRKIRTERF